VGGLSAGPAQDWGVFFRDSKSGFLRILAVGAWNTPARQCSRYCLNWANLALLPSWWILRRCGWDFEKTGLESLKKTLLSSVGLVESFLGFV